MLNSVLLSDGYELFIGKRCTKNRTLPLPGARNASIDSPKRSRGSLDFLEVAFVRNARIMRQAHQYDIIV